MTGPSANAATKDAVEHLRTLVAFDTTSRNSNLELIAHVETFLDQFGIQHRRFPNADGTKTNLFATIGPADTPGYVLSGHTDVVPVDGQAWSSDPFALRQADGRLYGRGSADMKGFLACCLAMVPEMVGAGLARPLHLAFSYDEEVGCVGVRGMLAELAKLETMPLGCFVGEPTSMKVVVGHKAKRSLKVRITGKSAHSSLAPQAVNAIEYGAALVGHIREIGERLEADGRKDDLYDIPFTTSHVGIMNGGTQLNIVPEACEIHFEFRALPEDDVDGFVEEVRRYAGDVLVAKMQRKSPGTGIEFEWISKIPGLASDPGNELVTLTKRLAGENGHSKVAYGTEAGLFQTMANIATVVCGPGSIEQAHKPDEFVEIDQLSACEQFIGKLIDHCRSD